MSETVSKVLRMSLRLSVLFLLLGVFLRTPFIVQMLQLAIKEVCSLLEDARGSLLLH